MNYNLSSIRSLGEYDQRITLEYRGSPKATGESFLTTLKAWHTPFEDLDDESWETGGIDWCNYSEMSGGGTSNTGSKADLTLVVMNEVNGKTKMNVFKCGGVTKQNMIGNVKSEMNRLFGYDLVETNPKVYIISVGIKLHD